MPSPYPPYRAQYADRDRIGAFLDDPELLRDDARRGPFGFATADEYAHWAPRLCGIACLQMVLDHHALGAQRSVADLTTGAVAAGAYGPAGWAYAPLVAYARTLGLAGAVRAPYSRAALVADLEAGRHPIVSVHPQVMRGEGAAPAAGERGGHLVLVLAVDEEHDEPAVVVHNPNARTRGTQEAYAAPLAQFEAAFAGRGLVLWRD